eukprot:scaffold1033_cov171-Amphora_coffeaeformis.AAC.41
MGVVCQGVVVEIKRHHKSCTRALFLYVLLRLCPVVSSLDSFPVLVFSLLVDLLPLPSRAKYENTANGGAVGIQDLAEAPDLSGTINAMIRIKQKPST